MDENDKKILELLTQNAKLTTSAIAKKTGIPITTVHNRIKRMERQGVIEGYSARINKSRIGLPIVSYILVSIIYTLPNGKKIRQEEVAKTIRKLPNVEEVSVVTGTADILLKLRAKDIESLNDFIIKKLREIEGVDKTQTMIVLSTF